MSNNPGKKGKPAPWDRAAQEHRDHALDDYRRAHHREYHEWRKRRSDAAMQFRAEENAKRPGIGEIHQAMKASDKRLRKWDKENPSPLSWDDYVRLEAEFDAQYIKPDFS
ncbi:hypothetical protein NFO65_13455 [Neorhizobium galegae]|uniref:hypothetical protein n=1 Tax=Neorhizobium galegae TaxID=399 RepID=UPI002101CE5D|nr:hypothetical protein [Neorhizobium galegae]MCQ1571733.1 hypothetical protein [Neorhizobium galegae]